jgi:hypothetical protein
LAAKAHSYLKPFCLHGYKQCPRYGCAGGPSLNNFELQTVFQGDNR